MDNNDFYQQLNVSDRTIRNYKSAINSKFLKGILLDMYGVTNLFEITNLKKLWDLYSLVNLHPYNVNNHRWHSAAVMKYIRYLNNGQKYGKRIDYKKPKQKTLTKQ